ncbi:hypothetical protein DFH09DRAFT_1190697 [Mycena vulgaris]|nr:hypothetical protein DFH09DRAFT_1190697 [Mycena vulgaris]
MTCCFLASSDSSSVLCMWMTIPRLRALSVSTHPRSVLPSLTAHPSPSSDLIRIDTRRIYASSRGALELLESACTCSIHPDPMCLAQERSFHWKPGHLIRSSAR